MEKSQKGKQVFTSKFLSRIERSLTNIVLGSPSKIPKSELPQDPVKDSLGSEIEFPILNHPSNTTTVTHSSATNANAGASSSNTSQEMTLFSRTRFGAGTQTNAGASSSNTSQELTRLSRTSFGAGTHINAGASSSNTSQELQINASTSNAGTSADSGAGDVGVDDAGTQTNAGALSSNTSQELTRLGRTRFGSGTDTNAGISSSNTTQEPQINTSTPNAGTSGDSGAGDIGVDDSGTAGGASTDDHQLAPSYAVINTIYQETGYIRSMAAGYDGVLFTGSDSKLVCEWNKGHPFARFKSSSGPVYAIVLQYPECRMFCAHNGGIIRVWESNIISHGMFRPSRILQKLRDRLKNTILLKRAVSCLCLSDDCNFIYSGSVDCTVNVWHIGGWELVETIRNHEGAINALAAGPGVVFSGSSDGTVKMWKRELYGEKGDKVRHLFRGLFIISKEVKVNAVAFGIVSSSCDLLYVGSSDGEVRCWRLLKDKPEVMSFHKGAVNCLALCSGPFVFSGSADMTICVWRRENEGAFHDHTRAMVLRGHSGPVHCIATQEDWEEDAGAESADRWVLYSGSLDRTLRIWRVYDRPLPKQSPPIIQHLEEVFLKKKYQEKVELRRIKSF